uniref:Reverse transcriptase Ty1/copia-type domain-containing protein n=1 Tax=Tanacetum cinerariifolium TaxID=118510 RepID=A0A6L2J2E2_TANCI|nr:hypothetical protein [Tanacetum cinerariifolium]
MEGWKPKSLKNKSFANIQELFDKAMKMMNTFVDYRTELVVESSKDAEAEVIEGSSKRDGEKIEQENAKRQTMKNDKESAEHKQCLEIIPEDGDDVTIDATPLSSKSPIIFDYKIHKERKKNYFQIFRADDNSRMYLTFSKMLKNFDREDLKVLWRLVKARFEKIKLVEYMDNLLLHNFKTMFEHHVEDNVWKNQQEFVNEPIVSEPIVKKPVVETIEARASADKPKVVRKNFGSPLIEDWISNSEDEAESNPKIEKKIVKPSFAKIEFVQVFLDKQLERMSTHNRIYVTPSHTKKIFGNMRRIGKGFSKRETPLFATMMVQAQEEMGKGSANSTDPHHTPTIIQPSTSQPQKKQKPRKTQRKDTELPQTSGPITNIADEAVNKEMDNSLVRAATTASSLEAEQDSARVDSSDEASIDEDASKQEKIINDIDADEVITLVDKTTENQGRFNDQEDAEMLFDVANDLRDFKTASIVREKKFILLVLFDIRHNVFLVLISKRVTSQDETPSLDNISTLSNRFENILGVTTNTCDTNGVEADLGNMENNISTSPTSTLRIHKDHPKSQIIGPVDTPVQTRHKSKEMEEQSFIATIHQKTTPDLLQVKPIGIKWVLKNKKDKRGIVIRNKARLVAQGHTQEEEIDYKEVFAPVAQIEAIRLLLAYASFMGFTVYQMDVKSAFLYGTIDEEVYVMQPLGFQDPLFPDKVYKVEKAMYGLHQAPKAWYGTLSKYLLAHGFQRALMHDKFQISDMGEINFFLGLQVLQKEDGIFLSQDKYVGDILKKFGYSDVRPANTPMDKENPWGKDRPGKDVELHLNRSMIGSLMYLTASRPDIMFAICVCARHQVTPKECHLHAVKRISRYLKGHPKLGLLAFCDYHNMIAILEKSEHNVDFHQIVDFVEASHIRIETTNEGTKILATIDGQFSHQWKFLIHTIMQCLSPKSTGFNKFSSNIATAVGEGSRTPTEPHHMPSPEAQQSPLHDSSSPLHPTATTETIPTKTPTEIPTLRQYSRRATRIAQSKALLTAADEPTSPLGDDSQGEAFPTVSSLEARQDRENIIKTSALLYVSTPRVTSFDADEGSMQQQLQKLTDLCTRLQRQQTKMASKITAQDLEISSLKARVKLLEDRDKRTAELSGDDAPIKGRSLETGEEASVERSTEQGSNDTDELVNVLTSMDATNLLTSGVQAVSVPPVAEVSIVGVPTGSGLVPTVSAIFTTASVVTPYSRRKGKEKMVESDTPKKKKLKEQIDVQMDREIKEEMARDAQRMNEQIVRDAEIARIHVEEELQTMIDGLDRSNEMIAKHLHEEKFIPVWKQIKDFVPMASKEEGERVKRKGLRLEQGSAKKMKTSEEVSEEALKEMMQLVPVEEVYMEALEVKHPIIEWKIHTEGKRDYWKIIRLGENTAVYQFFVDMLKQFDREDLNQLWIAIDEVNVVSTATTTTATIDDITLAKALMEIKSVKPKADKAEQGPTPIVSSQQPSQVKVQDKGKGKMAEPEPVKKLSKKDQLMLNEELAFKLQAEEEMLTREKAEQIEEVNIETGEEIEQENVKKQKMKDDKESVELKQCLEIILDDGDDVTIDATPLSSKSPAIVDYKIHKEGKKSYFQIFSADGNSHIYLTFSKMLKNFDREDLEVLWRLVKARFEKIKPVDYMDNLLLHNLKTMFEHHVEDNV